jgi:hypothetical protein
LGYYWNTIPIESGNFIFHNIFENLGTKKPENLKLHNFEKKNPPHLARIGPKKTLM